MDYKALLSDKKVVFFDGECNLCNFWVDFFIRKDKNGCLFFASLQSVVGQYILKENELDETNFDSFILYDKEVVYLQSTAAMYAFLSLPFPWKGIGFLIKIIPLPIRNAGYRFIARNRYRLFGKRETCRVPVKEETDRFL